MRGDLDVERLVDQHYAALYRFALSLSGNESDACDLVQETFYLLTTKGHQVNDATRIRSWLFTSLYRLFTNQRRRLVKFPENELSEVETQLPPVPPEMPTQPDWELLSACLARMDETFRAPIALFYLDDYSYQEIAEILQVPLGTVKSRIARGIATLQSMLTEREKSSPSHKPA
jgi:RNA polymerase sigma-70 factor (ECF subfamily)